MSSTNNNKVEIDKDIFTIVVVLKLYNVTAPYTKQILSLIDRIADK